MGVIFIARIIFFNNFTSLKKFKFLLSVTERTSLKIKRLRLSYPPIGIY